MAAGSADQPAPEQAKEQPYGILAVARMHKEDGRSLILYRRDDGVEEDGDTADTAPGAASAGDGHGEPT